MVGTLVTFIWWTMVLSLWGFAFMPIPGQSPEWFLQAQSACFGTLANGLPASHGWMLLILSPLALLSAMWASHAEELRTVPAFIRKSTTSKLFLLVLVPMTMLVAHWAGKRITYAVRLSKVEFESSVKEPLPADYPRTSQLVPEFKLINQSGQVINQEIFRGRVTLLTFAFAHCSTVCPILIKDVLTAQRQIPSQALQTIVITLDPWRDTPSTLPSAAKSWSVGESSYFLSGDPEAVNRALDGFMIKTARNEQDGNINHAPQVMIVDREGKIAYSFLNPSVAWLVTAATRVLNE
ncbi:MAG TPA: SCO family protein [Bdellovibrio sp.]|nr:SCO family protein [Bdellovibrio sp.]